MRRAKPQKSNLVKFLEEVGYEDIFDTNEIKEIKDMLNANPASMSKNEVLLDAIKPFENEMGQNDKRVKSAVLVDVHSKPYEDLASKYTLRGHLDAIRDCLFLDNQDIAVTVSEDWTIRLWDLKLLGQQDKELVEDIKYNFIDDNSEYAGSPNDIYSYYTLRGHTGIVTKVAQNHNSHPNKFIYTAGIEGIIRVWRVPDPSEVNQFAKDCDLSIELCIYIWEAHPNEIIWDLKHHPTDQLILSLGADDMVILWKTPKHDEIKKLVEEESDSKRLEDKLYINNFEPNDTQVNDTPICWEWINTSSNYFAVGYSSGTINLYEITHKTPISILYQPDNIYSSPKQQVNWMSSHLYMDLLFVGTEDGKIKVFDTEAGKLLKQYESPNGKPVNCIKAKNNGDEYIISKFRWILNQI